MRLMVATSLITACVTLAACNSMGRTVAPNTSGEAVVVLALSPANATTGVDPAKPIVITFSRGMMSGMESRVVLHEGSVTGSAVVGVAAWSTDRTTLTFTPSSPLKARTTYTVHLSPGLMSGSGQSIDLRTSMQLGGMYATGSMMGVAQGAGMMNGSWGPGMMGDGWRASDGTYGMVFAFTTA